MSDLTQILEAARWSPTAHNMQNFEILVIDDRDVLARLAGISSPASEVFIRENFDQLSFSEEELRRKKVGILEPCSRRHGGRPAPTSGRLPVRAGLPP